MRRVGGRRGPDKEVDSGPGPSDRVSRLNSSVHFRSGTLRRLQALGPGEDVCRPEGRKVPGRRDTRITDHQSPHVSGRWGLPPETPTTGGTPVGSWVNRLAGVARRAGAGHRGYPVDPGRNNPRRDRVPSTTNENYFQCFFLSFSSLPLPSFLGSDCPKTFGDTQSPDRHSDHVSGAPGALVVEGCVGHVCVFGSGLPARRGVPVCPPSGPTGPQSTHPAPFGRGDRCYCAAHA